MVKVNPKTIKAKKEKKKHNGGAKKMPVVAPKAKKEHLSIKPAVRQPASRTSSFNVNLASKISHEMNHNISLFKEKLQNFSFGELNRMYDLVPPSFLLLHLPANIAQYRTYIPKFRKGSRNDSEAFVKWFEWANFEVNKGKHFTKKNPDNDDESPTPRNGKMSEVRAKLAQTVAEREHVRALLQMCARHNSSKRKEGQHAVVNYLSSHLSDARKCASVEELRENAHHSVSYALSRLILGMVSEDAATVLLNTHTLHMVLLKAGITPSVLLSLLAEELHLSTRMKAAECRLRDGMEKDELDDDIDPDELHDPTKGERHQRFASAIFVCGAILCSGCPLSHNEIHQLLHMLSFLYIETRGLRVLAGNLILWLIKIGGDRCLDNEQTWKWICYAFFRFPKIAYYRPEGIQLLLFLMRMVNKPQHAVEIPSLHDMLRRDPLEPKTLEEVAGALFRRDQVTSTHPMIHPVWTDLLDLVKERCEAGESLRQHLTTIVHVVISPYRRGNAEGPRQLLFKTLIDRVGSLALQQQDAEQRGEIVKIASRTVGFARTKVPKTTEMRELRAFSLQEIEERVASLVRQLDEVKDHDPSASSFRTWALREMHNCLCVSVRDGTDTPYVNVALKCFFEQAFFPRRNIRDEINKNRAAYYFADTFSFTYTKPGALCRPKACVLPHEIISTYLAAEEQKKTRFFTAVSHVKFRKARNRIVDALDASQHSVLFYAHCDIQILLALLFVILSIDDHTNADALQFASATCDLCRFYLTGTIETIVLLFDVLMVIVMRPYAPVHVLPLLTAARRVSTGLLYQYSRFITRKEHIDMVLAPLVEAFRLRDNINDDDGDGAGEDHAGQPQTEDSSAEGSAEETASEHSDRSSVSDDRASESTDTASDAEASEEVHTDVIADDAEEEFEEEEAPTQQYLDSLKSIVGDVDLGFVYPTDLEGFQQNALMRAVTIASRIGLGMRSPVVIWIFRVLLAVMRANVKGNDAVFQAARSAVEVLLSSKLRFFGSFLSTEELFIILGELQTYCRKVEHRLVGGSDESQSQTHNALARKHLRMLKASSLSVFHYIGFLAFKNQAAEDVRITILEFYASVLFDRGMDSKAALPQIKKDLYHYRHGFAWVFLPAAIEKFSMLKTVDGASRAKSFEGACLMVESMLSRISGLPMVLKRKAAQTIRGFLMGLSAQQVYQIKHTAVHTFLHCVRMTLQYNSKVGLDTQWAADFVDSIVDDDSIMVTAASVRTLSAIERLLNKTPRAEAVKPTVSLQNLYQEYVASWGKKKSEFYQKSKVLRTKTLDALLSYKNDEPTEEKRAEKRKRSQELHKQDQETRRLLREERNRLLSCTEGSF